MADAPSRISFIASLPPIQSAISVSGTGDGARVKIDIPQNEADVIPLIQLFFSGVAFRVTMERIEQERNDGDGSPTVSRRAAKRRK